MSRLHTGYRSAQKAIEKRPDYHAPHIKPSHKGLLHKDLGIPQGQKIPMSKLEQAKHSENPAERRRATFAINFKK